MWQNKASCESQLQSDLVKEAHIFLAQLKQQLINKKSRMLTKAAEGTRAQTNDRDLFTEMPQTTSHPRLVTLWRLSVSRPNESFHSFVQICCLSSAETVGCRMIKLDTRALLPVTAPPIRSCMCRSYSLRNRDYSIYIESVRNPLIIDVKAIIYK